MFSNKQTPGDRLIPQVGMDLTVQIGSDRYASKITNTSKSGKTIWYERHGKKCRGFVNKFGNWVESGKCHWYITLGVADEYRDPSF